MHWDVLAKGIGCPFCAPRVEPNEFWETVAQLHVSTLCLLRKQRYRGHCILIYDPRHVVRPDQLAAEDWSKYASDLHRAVVAVTTTCQSDHINLACLGNLVPHLHWHLLPRYKHDPQWGSPVLDDRVAVPGPDQSSRSEWFALLCALRASLSGSS